jgi:hypothetical protein
MAFLLVLLLLAAMALEVWGIRSSLSTFAR